MLTHIDWLMRLEQHKDLLREAEQERLARLAISVQPADKAKNKTMVHKITQPEPMEVLCCNPAEIGCCPA